MEGYDTMKKLSLLLIAALGLSACNVGDRISDVGSAPKLATIENPVLKKDYQPITMPMPAPNMGEREPNSLWQTGSRAFLRDQRASRVGDIITVVIKIDDKAQIENQTKRTRDNEEKANLDNILGFEGQLKKWLPDAVKPDKLVTLGSDSKIDGKGSVDRSEKINVKIAAIITQILPNGNMVLQGKQQMVVNYDMRELQVSGVIRPEDISSENTVNYEQIAEARIAYGGKGQIMDVQQARYGQQVYDIIFPF
jgi:flagellar L-ring protein FlgH